MEKPYIGVTGLTKVDHVREICGNFKEFRSLRELSHLSMLGFLVSYKTLNGEEGSKRYPKVRSLRELLEAADEGTFTTIHYNSRHHIEHGLAAQVSKVFDGIYQDELGKGLQLNIPWPNPNQVSRMKKEFPEMKIIFQVSSRTMEGHTSKSLAKGLKEYGDDLSYVLIDPSGGKGLDFDVNTSFEIYRELREKHVKLAVGFAGGLKGSVVMDKVQRLANHIGNKRFSIDAEGGLRDEETDELNLNKVKNYVRSSYLAFLE